MFNTRWFLDYCNAEWKQTYCGPTTKDTQHLCFQNKTIWTSALFYENRSPLLHMLHLSSFLATSRDNLKQVLKKNKDSLWIHVWSLPETIFGKIPKRTMETTQKDHDLTKVHEQQRWAVELFRLHVCGRTAALNARTAVCSLFECQRGRKGTICRASLVKWREWTKELDRTQIYQSACMFQG